jgi:hypothetical protein
MDAETCAGSARCTVHSSPISLAAATGAPMNDGASGPFHFIEISYCGMISPGGTE